MYYVNIYFRQSVTLILRNWGSRSSFYGIDVSGVSLLCFCACVQLVSYFYFYLVFVVVCYSIDDLLTFLGGSLPQCKVIIYYLALFCRFYLENKFILLLPHNRAHGSGPRQHQCRLRALK